MRFIEIRASVVGIDQQAATSVQPIIDNKAVFPTCLQTLEKAEKTRASRTMPPRGLEVYLRSRVMSTFDLLILKGDRFMPLPPAPLMSVGIKVGSFVMQYYASTAYVVVRCLSVCPSVCHVRELCQNK